MSKDQVLRLCYSLYDPEQVTTTCIYRYERARSHTDGINNPYIRFFRKEKFPKDNFWIWFGSSITAKRWVTAA